MMYKAIVTDLDGTLLTTDKRISEENKRSLHKADEQGVQVILCSGRSPKSMQRYVDALSFKSSKDYFMGNHGGVVVKADTGEIIEANYLPEDRVRWFVETGRKYAELLNVHLYQGDYFLIERRDESTDLYEKLTSMKAGILVPDLMEYIDKKIVKALFISSTPNLVLEMKEKLESENMPIGMHLVGSSAYLLEYADDVIDKGTAVSKLMERLQISMDEVICVGDSFNDISMIQKAGLGVAVQNAEAEVKAIAKYVTRNTNDQHAIAEIVDKFILKQ